mmetsp:Transcript_68370/g.163193  ORF Transcript_68370/g.163193 Transcript_68370/m.163193 type:complete len:244 (+) Transcript_68370:565-1296(+)
MVRGRAEDLHLLRRRRRHRRLRRRKSALGEGVQDAAAVLRVVPRRQENPLRHPAGGSAHLRPSRQPDRARAPLLGRLHCPHRRNPLVQLRGGPRGSVGPDARYRLRHGTRATYDVRSGREAHPHRHRDAADSGAVALQTPPAVELRRVGACGGWTDAGGGWARSCSGAILRGVWNPPAHPPGARQRHLSGGVGGGLTPDRSGCRRLHLFRQHPPGPQVGVFREHARVRVHQARTRRTLRRLLR